MRDGSHPTPRAGVHETTPRDSAAFPETIGDRYRVDHRVAEGGMATVFLAHDLKHGREVAVKILHETLAHTIGIQRFLREIEVIARLQHPHLLTLIDSGEVDGLPYYVMPYVEAQSLRETIATRGKLPIKDAVTIAREVADGLAYAHQHGVVHRDIKPSNILMSGGHAVVVDFGIATALQNAGAGRITETGISLGSPTYMSPEQAAGERDLDARTDVYSLACVLFEMLAGEPPIDRVSMQAMVTRKLTGGFTPVHQLRPDVPPTLEAAVHKALAADRNARFTSVEEFSSAIAAALPSARPVSSRMRWIAGVALVVVAALVFMAVQHERQVVWATQRVSEVNRKAQAGEFASAFLLAKEILPVIPRDSTLRRIRPVFTDFLKMVTSPAGARLSMQRLGGGDSAWQYVGTTPLDSVPMPKYGQDVSFKLRFEKSGYETVELLPIIFSDWAAYRNIRALDTLRLDPAGKMPGMVRITGFQIRDTLHGDRRGSVTFADYYIGKTEVTNREYMRFVDAGGYRKREYWTEPMLRDRRELPWDEAMSLFHDRSGLPGPSSWSGGTFPPGQAEFPVGGVSYYEAAAYARFVGRQLPTSTHWARAAQRYLRDEGWIYLGSSNLNALQPRRVGQGIMNANGLYDIAGNVREWCVNPVDDGRLTRGGAWDDAEFLAVHLIAKPELDRSPGNGFRVVALSDADTTIAHLSGRINRRVPRDFNKVVAVSDAEFAIYRRIFDYDRKPLEARREGGGTRDLFRWEKVSFTAAYGGERMAAYLLLPKDAPPPYEPVIYWPGSNAMTARALDLREYSFENTMGFIPRSGRALVIPLFKGAYERDDSAFSTVISVPDSSTYYRDLAVQWIKDFRRTIDYLETRSDMKPDHLGYFGFSWGGEKAPVALAVEPRVKAAVLNVGGYWPGPSAPQPEVEAANYTPRVKTPTLMLNGRHDVVFPYETSQLPFFRQLGTAPADKKHVVYQSSHILPPDAMARETLAWFDRYLSGKGALGRRGYPDRPEG
jgi:formylglycine-generating enzyme required for sulfatase activity